MNIEILKRIEHYYGTFAAFWLDEDSKKRISAIANEIADIFACELIDEDEYHVTVVYTDDPLPKLERFNGRVNEYGHPLKFSLFGPDMDYLVLEIGGETIIDFKEYISKNYRHLEKYSAYKPHISIAKGFVGDIDRLNQIFSPSDIGGIYLDRFEAKARNGH